MYASKDGYWKIADFGLMSKGTTTQAIRTDEARGKSGYRAPELLMDSNPSYNKKVDVWSVGCILYYLCVGEKAFKGDGSVLLFSLQNKSLDVHIPQVNEHMYDPLQQLISSALHPDSQNRPSVASLRVMLQDVAHSLFPFTVVIGIDFGTAFTSVAWSVVDESQTNDQIIESISIVSRWPGFLDDSLWRTPTIIAYNQSQVIWGGLVRPFTEPQISYFRLGLDQRSTQHYNLPAAVQFKHPRLPDKSAVDFSTDYLACILKYVHNEVLPKSLGSRSWIRSQKHYVMTYPVFWTDTAKNLLCHSASLAGIPDDMLTLVSETEAALYFAIAKNGIRLSDNRQVLVCHVGERIVVISPVQDNQPDCSRISYPIKSSPCFHSN